MLTRGDERQPLPDSATFEQAVDEMLAAWPPGNFDSTPDLVSNPGQIPSSFTFEAHPYGWTGFAAVGPFQGLTTLNSNVHGLNADATLDRGVAPAMFGMDPELYLGILLQAAANPAFFDPATGQKPPERLAVVDPTPSGPGLAVTAALPTYPKATFVATNSLLVSLPDYPVAHHLNAMSAFQNTLMPPEQPPNPVSWEQLVSGRAVFDAAGCGECHNGPAFTNHDVMPVAEIGTEPARAPALKCSQQSFAPSVLYPANVLYPLPPNPPVVDVPVDEAKRADVKLAWAHGERQGGYKVAPLIGLAWSAPYLHHGGWP